MKVTVRIVLERAGAGCGPRFGVLVPNPTTVEENRAARWGLAVELRTPDRGDHRAQRGRLKIGAAGKPRV